MEIDDPRTPTTGPRTTPTASDPQATSASSDPQATPAGPDPQAPRTGPGPGTEFAGSALTLAGLAADAWSLMEDTPRAVLGLAGPPGAGKSTLARALVAHLGEGAAYLPLDGFHLSNAQLERLGLTARKGSEPSFDVWGYVDLLRRVLDETVRDIYVPDYDRTLHEPVAARHLVPPAARLVVTEGNYLACDLPGWRDAYVLMGECWYVEAPGACGRRGWWSGSWRVGGTRRRRVTGWPPTTTRTDSWWRSRGTGATASSPRPAFLSASPRPVRDWYGPIPLLRWT